MCHADAPSTPSPAAVSEEVALVDQSRETAFARRVQLDDHRALADYGAAIDTDHPGHVHADDSRRRTLAFYGRHLG